MFEKGKSGNPDKVFKKGHAPLKGCGRPKKIPELHKLLCEVLGEKKNGITAAEGILKVLRAKAMKGDIRACELLLDRAYGKSKEFIEQINKNEIDLTSLSDDELKIVAIINSKIKKQ